MQILFEVIFLGFIVVIAHWQAEQFTEQKAINHWVWFFIFSALIVGAWLLEERSYWFAGALALEHFVLFSPILNFFRTPRMPFFYIHKAKGGSLWDSVLIKLGKAYPFIWSAGALAFGWLQIKLT
jgi:hypothetical protein